MAMEGDPDECKVLIDKAKTDIDNLQFDEDKTLDENKAAVDAIVDQLATDLATERTNGIEAIRQSEAANGQWYDLQGRRLNAVPTRKGVYIQNGKTIVVK